MSNEEDMNKLKKEIAHLKKQLDDSHAATMELTQENQNLKVAWQCLESGRTYCLLYRYVLHKSFC